MKTLFLCGGGNSEGVRLALRLNRQYSRWGNIVLLDDDREKHGRSILGVEIAGSFDHLAGVDPARSETTNLVARTTAKRRAAQERIDAFGIPRATLIDSGIDLEGVELGDNLVVYQHSVIGPETTIGDGTVIFMGAIVGHESRVGPGCILAPQAVLNARVTLGRGVYVGTHAAVLPEIEVGDGAVVGAGSVVMQAVPAGATVMGVPAQLIAAIPSRFEQDAPVRSECRPEDNGSASAPSLETMITDVWKDALGVDRVGASDNFFRLGGNSLAALRIAFQLRQLLQIDITLQMVIDTPTVRALAARLEPLVLGQADEALLGRLVDQLQ